MIDSTPMVNQYFHNTLWVPAHFHTYMALGVIFFIISVLPIREWIVNAIPKSLKMAIAAGIGLFLALIALKNAGIVVGDNRQIASAREDAAFFFLDHRCG